MMDINTGKALSSNDGLNQSIRLIITTPCRERVLNRGFGSDANLFLGQPINAVAMQLSAEIITSVERGDSRIKVEQVSLNNASANLSVDVLYNAREVANVQLS